MSVFRSVGSILGGVQAGGVTIGHGWNTLPLGAGGLVTGMFIADDGSMVSRTDVGNGYRWSGKTSDYADPSKRWVPLLTYAGLGSSVRITSSSGMWEHVLAPGNSAIHVAIFSDIAGSGTKGWVYYGTWDGTKVAWNQSNLAFLNSTVDTNASPYKDSYYKIIVDPVNENVAYCGMPTNSGNSAGAYTTLNTTGGSTLATWASVKTDGTTPVGAVTTGVACGLAFDRSQGTTTVGGQTVTKRIIIPVGGVGIFESTDGGQTFTEIAATSMGTATFYVTNAAVNSNGVYYCVVVSSTIGGVWRYASGVWTRINPTGLGASSFAPGQSVIIKPSDPTYLSTTGQNGLGAGFTSFNADTGSPPTWNGRTGGQNPTLQAASYDIGYLNNIFGQGSGIINTLGAITGGSSYTDGYYRVSLTGGGGSGAVADVIISGGAVITVKLVSPGHGYAIGDALSATTASLGGTGSGFSVLVSVNQGAFTFGPAVCIDPLSGACFWSGNQSVWYFAASAVSTVPTGPPNYATDINTFSWSMGRGQEATVAEDAICPPGSTYPVLAVQDLGAPMRGTFITYPQDILVRRQEFTCENLEYAASDSSFIVARATGQAGSFTDVSAYNTNYGADGSWKLISDTPTRLWQATLTGTISNGSGGAGNILTVTAISGHIFPNSFIDPNSSANAQYGRVQPYGTSGTTGTGGLGTYIMSATSSVLTSTSLFSAALIQGGQTVAVDHDHWVTVPAGLTVSPIPAYTANATGAATWALCNGLPAANWMLRPWTFGGTSKPFAVGYGSDLGKVWAFRADNVAGAGTLYRSDDSGANFSQIATWPISVSIGSGGVYCLSVPGFPGELWVTAAFTGGSPVALWHVTNANTSDPVASPPVLTVIPLPTDANLPHTITLGRTGAPLSLSAYPTIYLIGSQSGNPNAPQLLYQGAWDGSTAHWSRYGPTGTQQDFPQSCQMLGFKALRGDWNVYGRLYGVSAGAGLAYYNP